MKINRCKLALACLLCLVLADVQAQLNSHPPRIVVSSKPMELMLIDGPPTKVQIDGTGLEYVVNTNWNIFHSPEMDTWYILKDGSWLFSNMLSSGQWRSTIELPADFLTLQVSSNWRLVAAAMPPRKPETPARPFTISYEPTELVLIDGPAELEAIGEGGLQFVSNTRNDLFLFDSQYYLLISGRWFRTKDVKRQWSPVKQLPLVFAEIPADHRKAEVLSSVAGTPQAKAAVAEAAKPKLAKLSVKAGDNMQVPYVGEPSFVEIEGTELLRAENTPYQVIMHNNFYYLCHDGAWYSSTGATGPWRAATEVPEAMYTIPPTDPAYNVTFVRVEAFDDSSDKVAYTSTSGYYNRYYNGATMVYGTGWYYPGYYNRSAYWRYPSTYGYGRWGHYPGYGYHGYSHSETYRVNLEDTDWEWNLDGSKRRVYKYGPRNTIGSGEYRMPESDNYKGDGK